MMSISRAGTAGPAARGYPNAFMSSSASKSSATSAQIPVVELQDPQVEQFSPYAKRKKVYPRWSTGLFAHLRLISAWALLGLYYGLPWLQWNGRQAILFDLPERKFHLFGLILWPQDFIFLAWLLVLAALTLFFVTAIAGRLWCGYACPQTVWTKVFLWMERITEGDRNKRIKLDQMPLNPEKVLRKTAKHSLWLVFAFATGVTFVGYFTPITTLTANLIGWQLGGWETFWVLFYGFATYGNAGWLREQVCIHMCPYGRFQAAMFDRDTLIISYDTERGESRGARKREADLQALELGDCIDCTLCVQVCPTGIDIRDGLQLECIACAACIDVCDQVMDKMGYEKGLIRYTTENALEHKTTRVIRPRIVVYAILLTLLLGGFMGALYLRTPLGLDVIRDRNVLYRMVSDPEAGEMVENVYTIKVLNKDEFDHVYQLTLQDYPHAEIASETRISVAGGKVASVPIRVRIPVDDLKVAATTFHFHIEATDSAGQEKGLETREKAQFIGPF